MNESLGLVAHSKYHYCACDRQRLRRHSRSTPGFLFCRQFRVLVIANRCNTSWVLHFRSLFCRSGRRPYSVLSADRPAPCTSQDAQKLVALSFPFERAFGGAGAAGSSFTDTLTLPAPKINKGTQVFAAAFQRCDAHFAHSLTLAQRDLQVLYCIFCRALNLWRTNSHCHGRPQCHLPGPINAPSR